MPSTHFSQDRVALTDEKLVGCFSSVSPFARRVSPPDIGGLFLLQSEYLGKADVSETWCPKADLVHTVPQLCC